MPRPRTGHLVLRGGIWHAQVTTDEKGPDGKVIRDWLTLDTPDHATAKRRLARYIAEQAAGRTPEAAAAAASAPDTVAAYATRLGSRLSDGDHSNLKLYVLPVIGKMALDEVRAAHVKRVRDKVLAAPRHRPKGEGAEKLRRGTLGKVLGATRRLFAAAVEDEFIEQNPASDVRLPKQRGGRPRDQQAARDPDGRGDRPLPRLRQGGSRAQDALPRRTL
jgi:hypothetical protein